MRKDSDQLPLIIVAAYSLFPKDLFSSVMQSGIAVQWHIHYHGPHQDVADSLKEFCDSQPFAALFDHRENRGLARSWNDSLRSLEHGQHSMAFIFNDDLAFTVDGFKEFVSFVYDRENIDSTAAFYTVNGQEVGASALSGEVHVQSLACCALNAAIVRSVGYFDEVFSPAYFEDCDYLRRIKIAGVPLVIDSRVLCMHERSATLRGEEDLRAASGEWWERNKAYYIRKWGGEPDNESFSTPFNG